DCEFRFERHQASILPSRRAARPGRDLAAASRREDALNDTLVQGMVAFFDALPGEIRAVVLAGDGEHFSAGLDLTELEERDVFGGVAHSSSWHRAFERIEFGK